MITAGPSNNWHYNPNLKAKAQELRNNMTKAEAYLWKFVLRGKLFQGYTFKRQRPVLNYIADFLCLDLMLIIEVDGSSHDLPEVYDKDEVRTEELEAVGFTILRFSNDQILNNIESVRRQLDEWIEERNSLN